MESTPLMRATINRTTRPIADQALRSMSSILTAVVTLAAGGQLLPGAEKAEGREVNPVPRECFVIDPAPHIQMRSLFEGGRCKTVLGNCLRDIPGFKFDGYIGPHYPQFVRSTVLRWPFFNSGLGAPNLSTNYAGHAEGRRRASVYKPNKRSSSGYLLQVFHIAEPRIVNDYPRPLSSFHLLPLSISVYGLRHDNEQQQAIDDDGELYLKESR